MSRRRLIASFLFRRAFPLAVVGGILVAVIDASASQHSSAAGLASAAVIVIIGAVGIVQAWRNLHPNRVHDCAKNSE
jgi:hypothetical protein